VPVWLVADSAVSQIDFVAVVYLHVQGLGFGVQARQYINPVGEPHVLFHNFGVERDI
jgi:hypothetical protein